MSVSPFFATNAISEDICAQEETDSTYYPTSHAERAKFRTETGKRLSPHQWAVYDFVLGIPEGKVTTYRNVSAAVGGSPRSVGNALKNNPFAPYVPCHRVVASDLSLGGFFGERATSKSARGGPLGENCQRKVELLIREGVLLGKGGRCVVKDAIWEK